MMSPRKRREQRGEPRQTPFLKSAPQVKNGDILDVDEAAALLKVSKKTIYTRVKHDAIPYAKLGRKLLFHRQTLEKWIADGGDRAQRTSDSQGEQLTLDALTGMLNSGQAKITTKR